jgi:hypothetical protein
LLWLALTVPLRAATTMPAQSLRHMVRGLHFLRRAPWAR